MPKLLHLREEAAKKFACQREESFVQLHKFLGDKEAQDEIRKVEKDKSHCKFLLEDCNACEALPRDVGDHKEGDPCPNNPLHKHKEIYEQVFEKRFAFAEFSYLEQMVILNLLPPITELSSAEMAAATAIAQHRDAKTMMGSPFANIGSGEEKKQLGKGPIPGMRTK